MRVRTELMTSMVVLLSLLSFPVTMYVNVSTCSRQMATLPQQLQGAKLVVALRPLTGDLWSLSPRGNHLPQTRRIFQAGASFVAVNFERLDLLPGDKLVVRDPNGTTITTAMTTNTSALTDTVSTKAPLSLLLQTHPFLVRGDTLVIEYFPSVMTAGQRDKPAVTIESYSYIINNNPKTRGTGGFRTRVRTATANGSTSSAGSSGFVLAGVDTESTIRPTDEAKEAVCYRKSQPKMYAKARAVARLMIRSDQSPQDQTSCASERLSTWAFCTGWLVGRGNHLLTNYHCMKNAAVAERAVRPALPHSEREGLLSSAVTRLWPHGTSLPNKTGNVVDAIVSFMAETKSCREAGFMGEKVGVVEATRAVIVAENPDLDYALLRVLVNNSATNLSQRYGYLRLRETGPVNGEEIYIPQHPHGEPKEIAATKDGKPAVIEVPTASPMGSESRSYAGYLRRDRESDDTQPMVLYNADTEPGSSGSPVLSREDNTVVALHRAGSSEALHSVSPLFNVGIRTDLIARDLQRRNVLPRNSLVS